MVCVYDDLSVCFVVRLLSGAVYLFKALSRACFATIRTTDALFWSTAAGKHHCYRHATVFRNVFRNGRMGKGTPDRQGRQIGGRYVLGLTKKEKKCQKPSDNQASIEATLV